MPTHHRTTIDDAFRQLTKQNYAASVSELETRKPSAASTPQRSLGQEERIITDERFSGIKTR